jgi:hypothetical protein
MELPERGICLFKSAAQYALQATPLRGLVSRTISLCEESLQSEAQRLSRGAPQLGGAARRLEKCITMPLLLGDCHLMTISFGDIITV